MPAQYTGMAHIGFKMWVGMNDTMVKNLWLRDKAGTTATAVTMHARWSLPFFAWFSLAERILPCLN